MMNAKCGIKKKFCTLHSALCILHSALNSVLPHIIMIKKSVLRDKSYAFALRIVKLAHHLCEKNREYILSKQILRSGTAIGALVRESERAESKLDFAHKLNIALKEACETDYWLSLLKDSDLINEKSHMSLFKDCQEWISILVASINTANKNNRQNNQKSNQ